MMSVSITIDVETDWGGRQDVRVHNYGIEDALPNILQFLRRRRIKATFFVCGIVLENYADKILDIKDHGHEIQCHGYQHHNFSKLTIPEIRDDLLKCQKIFINFGIDITGFRSPQGLYNKNLFSVLAELGFTYDSSLIRARVPGRYDNTRKPIKPYEIKVGKNTIKEIPMSPIPKINLPLGLLWINTLGFNVFKKLSTNMTDPAVFYVHPFDIVFPKPSFEAGILKRGWYSFRQENAEKTLKKLLSFFNGNTKTMGEIALSI